MLVLCGLAVMGCTFEPGNSFGTLQPASIEAAFEAGDARDLGDGVFLTSEGYHIALTELRLQLATIDFQESRGSAGTGGTFDPANPPPGYSLCHNGHCHADDGGLVDYEDIQNELTGGAATFGTLATLRVDSAFDLLDPFAATASEYEPTAELGRTTIARCAVYFGELTASGTVTSGELEEMSVLLTVELTLEEPVVAVVARTVDRNAPAEIHVDVRFQIGPTLFDDLDFAGLVEDDAISISNSDAVSMELVAHFHEESFVIEFDELGGT